MHQRQGVARRGRGEGLGRNGWRKTTFIFVTGKKHNTMQQSSTNGETPGEWVRLSRNRKISHNSVLLELTLNKS